MPVRLNQRTVRTHYYLRIAQLDEASVILNQIINTQGRQSLRMEDQVLLNFLADNFGQNKPADLSSANGQHGLIEAPGRDDPCCEHIRIQKETNSAAGGGHLTCELRREPRFTALVVS